MLFRSGIVKHSDKETLRFLDIALGSLAELDTQMEISLMVGLINQKSEDNCNRFDKKRPTR